ncbi:hypothetical protein OE88DRAFT_1320541 [Heliocybe sulcata]|uniref:Uncharacterized protein n=1 Tax=Heliocybe sulcata TaxID=5364 RepID=A0A5C3N582_9AGAM|nr:hypothetical protein OE88DRAFT_1320541 [Heliocybe sulcata]
MNESQLFVLVVIAVTPAFDRQSLTKVVIPPLSIWTKPELPSKAIDLLPPLGKLLKNLEYKVSYTTTSTKISFDMVPSSGCPPPFRADSAYEVPHSPTQGPIVPCPEEAALRYHGLPSRPRFVARSSSDEWVPPGFEGYPEVRELRPVGIHPLCSVWEDMVDVAMHIYLTEQNVRYTSLDPVRIGLVDEPAAPVIVWVGVEPSCLYAEQGILVAVGLRDILIRHGIDDVHVEIRESVVTTSAKMYKPALSSSPIVQVSEPFSTSLGISVCSDATPDVQGTATLFFVDSSKPGRLFLLAPRHVLFHPHEIDRYEYRGTGPRRNILLLGKSGMFARIKDIEKEIWGTEYLIAHYKDLLESADKMEDPQAAQARRESTHSDLLKAEGDLEHLRQFLADVRRDWENARDRIIGHVILSPPLTLNAGKGGFTRDFAVIEVNTTKIDSSNFIGNAIDLGTKIPIQTLACWMHPSHTNQPSFKYPSNRLLHFRGTLSTDEMHSPNAKNVDDRGDPTIMVLKHGSSSGLTIGCLNSIRAVVRRPFTDGPTGFSREVIVLPRSSKSGAFSECGDSGAVMINGLGAVAGMLTAGNGATKVSDCSYVTPITCLLECLKECDFSANIFPVAVDVRD